MTYEEGRDEVLALITAAWDTLSPVPPLFYWDVAHAEPKEGTWGRVTMRFLDGAQGAFVLDSAGVPKKWERRGNIFVQVFTQFGTGLSESDRIAKVAADAFEGKTTPGGVWFRNVRRVDIGQDGAFFQTQVRAEFEYDEVK